MEEPDRSTEVNSWDMAIGLVADVVKAGVGEFVVCAKRCFAGSALADGGRGKGQGVEPF